jgi:hypothetical protein
MLYPRVTEISRAGAPTREVPSSQRELVALSLRVNPPVRTVKPVVERDLRGGFSR